MSKIMGIYVKFTKSTHQMWSCHVTLASNSKNFYFSPNSVLNFRGSYQVWGKFAQEQKVTGKNKLGVENPPSAYRVKVYVWRIQKYKFCLSVTIIVATATLLLKNACPFFKGKIAKNGQYRLDIGL